VEVNLFRPAGVPYYLCFASICASLIAYNVQWIRGEDGSITSAATKGSARSMELARRWMKI
jgi:hypothetical protein